MTSSQKRAELKRLSKQCQSNLFEMLKIVHELLADHEYVDQFGGESQLIDHIEEEEFSHFGGHPKLATMLHAYRTTPQKTKWAEYKFNIQAMIELASPERESAEVERINWKARCKELEAKVTQLQAIVDDQRATVGQLRGKCESLTAEVGELKGRLAERRERHAA